MKWQPEPFPDFESQAEYDSIRAAMKAANGWIGEPMVIDVDHNLIDDGYKRMQVARDLGLKTVENVYVLERDERTDEERAVLYAELRRRINAHDKLLLIDEIETWLKEQR